MNYGPTLEQMQNLPIGLQNIIVRLPIDEPIEAFKVNEVDSICKVVIETASFRDTLEYDCQADKLNWRDVEGLGECVTLVIEFDEQS
jgi:hypothetical protein